jgi:hypothetical protein
VACVSLTPDLHVRHRCEWRNAPPPQHFPQPNQLTAGPSRAFIQLIHAKAVHAMLYKKIDLSANISRVLTDVDACCLKPTKSAQSI